MVKNTHHSISVVIATLGGSCLFETISHLQNSTLVPDEILICIPEGDSHRVASIKDTNVKIVETQCRGQVAQRAVGFSKAISIYVMQLDDDILLDRNAIKKLVSALEKLNHGNVIAPVYYDKETGRCLHELQTGFKGLIKSFYSSVICGALFGEKRMGTFTSLGISYGVDPKYIKDDIIEVDWLPGGCVLGFRQELINEPFYPFKGKAYLEDILHSILRQKKGINHFVVPKAICKTDIQPLPQDLTFTRDDLIARKYIIKLISGKQWHLLLWSVFDYLKVFIIYNVRKYK